MLGWKDNSPSNRKIFLKVKSFVRPESCQDSGASHNPLCQYTPRPAPQQLLILNAPVNLPIGRGVGARTHCLNVLKNSLHTNKSSYKSLVIWIKLCGTENLEVAAYRPMQNAFPGSTTQQAKFKCPSKTWKSCRVAFFFCKRIQNLHSL